MKMAFLIHHLAYSGAPKMLAWVANQMADRGHEVIIVSFFSDKIEQSLRDNISFVSLSVKKSKSRLVRNTIGMLKTVARLRKFINSQNPDVVISFLDSVGYIYLWINRLLDKHKVIVSERSDPYQYHGIIGRLRTFLIKYADGVVFQTEGAMNYFDACVRNMGVVIPNPVVLKKHVSDNIQQFRFKYKQRDNRIVTVGRLSILQKRHDVLLDAFSIVHKKHPEITLHIYGDGSDKDEIFRMIKERHLEYAVFLEGKTSNVEKDICSARVFALSSDFEGIPNALIEAMSIGVPCVSTNCSPGGAALLINNGENGYLTEKSNAKDLAEKLIVLIENEAISNKLSDNAVNISETFSESVVADKWEKFSYKIINYINGM